MEEGDDDDDDDDDDQMHSVLCKFRKFLTIQNTAI